MRLTKPLRALLLALPALTAVIAYLPGLHGGFIFDDFPNLVDDPDWKLTSLNFDSLWRALSMGFSGLGGRPLSILSFSLNYYFSGLNPFSLKLTNLAFHSINAVLTTILVKQLIDGSRPKMQSIGLPVASLIGLLWALHPLLVSSVLYIVQRMEVAAYTCILAALCAYAAGRDRQQSGLTAWHLLALCPLLIFVGLGFKETALLIPAYTLICEIFIFRFLIGTPDRERRVSRWWVGLYSFGVLTALTLYFAIVLPWAMSPGLYAARPFSLAQRLLTQLCALATYMEWIFIPNPASYVFYYDNFPISKDFFSPAATAWSALLIFTLIACAIHLRKTRPIFSLGIAWFFVSHLLTSNVVPLELVFEHRNYGASFGLILAAYGVIAPAIDRLHSDAKMVVSFVLIIGMFVLCSLQVRTWSTPFSLALSLESRNATSPRATYDLGRLMLERANGDPESPFWQLAYREFEASCNLPSSSTLCDQAMLVMLGRANKPAPISLWNSFQLKLSRARIGPEAQSALYALLDCRIKRQCIWDDKQLFQAYATALKKNPDSFVLITQYSMFAYHVIGDRDLAISTARNALMLAPKDPQAQLNLAKFLATSPEESQHAEAETIYGLLSSKNSEKTYADDMRQLREILDSHTTKLRHTSEN